MRRQSLSRQGVLDVMALPVECPVVRYHELPAPGEWDAGLDATLKEVGAEPGAVVAAVAEQIALAVD